MMLLKKHYYIDLRHENQYNTKRIQMNNNRITIGAGCTRYEVDPPDKDGDICINTRSGDGIYLSKEEVKEVFSLFPEEKRHHCTQTPSTQNVIPAIYGCYESQEGRLTVYNKKYENNVDFCPYCGFKAKKAARKL